MHHVPKSDTKMQMAVIVVNLIRINYFWNHIIWHTFNLLSLPFEQLFQVKYAKGDLFLKIGHRKPKLLFWAISDKFFTFQQCAHFFWKYVNDAKTFIQPTAVCIVLCLRGVAVTRNLFIDLAAWQQCTWLTCLCMLRCTVRFTLKL